MATRTVRKQYLALSDDIGDLRTQRPLPNRDMEQIDPFLFLNHHGPQVYPPGNRGLPFGPHPHRGFETVTFILEGSLMHRDTGGHESVIEAGGVQWMTAGRGLEHAELSPREFMEKGGPLEILQLWINLPSRLKMTDPRYTGLQRDEIPCVTSGDGAVSIRLIAGEVEGQRGPVESLTDVHMMVLELRHAGTVTLPVARDRNVFLYVVRGEVTIGDETISELHLVHLNDDGDEVTIAAVSESIVLFGHALPYGEPVVSHGPFVMNTVQEIMEAIRDYQAGRFAGTPI
jgi:quercetin 2,3-dioxygenase